MEKTFVIITAQTQVVDKNRDPSIPLDPDIPTFYGEQFCSLMGGIIQKMCSELSVKVLKSECFEDNGRMAMIIRADATDLKCSLDSYREALVEAGRRISATVRVQKEDLFKYMHRI